MLAIVLVGILVPKGTAQTTPGPAEGAPAPGSAREAGAILANQCVACHGPEKKKGGLDLSRRASAMAGGESGAAIVPGRPAESPLVEKVTDGEMPPKGALSKDEIATVRAWVEAGAPYPAEPLSPRKGGNDWWSLRPIRRVVPPALYGPAAAWARNPVDAFVLAALHSAGLQPAPEADRATLIRRVSFDLIGLPPTPDQVDAFVNDPDPGAYEALVDRLLASAHHGERWGRHWLDVVRFGESEGYETNMPRFSAWPYRDYVIRAFNRDTPFPRFVLEQLAGDTLTAEGSDWLTRAATGFLVGGTRDIVGNQTVEGMLQQRADDLDDMITATGTTFLGLTIQCARCHDHKFDPITQRDYYGVQAVYAGVRHGEREVDAPDAGSRRREAAAVSAELVTIERRLDETEPLANPAAEAPTRPMVNPRRNVERFAAVKARMIRFTILATNNQIEPCIDELEVYTAAQGASPARTEPRPPVVAVAREGEPPGEPLAQKARTEPRPPDPPRPLDAPRFADAPRNVALASAGGIASASSEYPESAIHKIVHLNDGRHGNSRSWISRTAGRGMVTIAWTEPETIDRIVWGRDREGVYSDRLAIHYYIETAMEPGGWRVVASSIDRAPYHAEAADVAGSPGAGRPSAERAEVLARRAALRERLAGLGSTIKVFAGTFGQPGPTHLLVRGDPTRKGVGVVPAGIASVVPRLTLDAGTSESNRRAALARWLADPANPLPARVMVNRVWHYHFGRGIVATPGDFGFNGAPPSHPELLDWLAGFYLSHGWQLKPIHRLIVLSATYRQSSRLDAKAQAVDRDNRLLWRVAPRRLEAESIRDAILATSGRLNPRMGGPGYNIWEKNTNYVAVYKPRAELGPDDFRRMVYQFKPRSQQDPTFGAFDCPDAALVAPRRNVSTTALQALNLLNSEFLIRQAGFFADRLRAEAGPDPACQAERGFRLALGRPPTAVERTAAARLIDSHGAAAFCRALYNANEFVYVP
jgi:mono/diheme cytochrome c family protein